ncbi:MAG: Holliday junction resolvase RuvX [Mycoplasmataceae bacterium]|jgi:putative Holliday junction resolvase|nr:Holliday junction resolvase RuvX [Mycoplasmataceae bacterium]
MRIIALDLGTKTMGIAVSDSNKIIASGVENFFYANNDLNLCIIRVKKLLEYYQGDVEGILLGYPTFPSGDKSAMSHLVEKFRDALKLVLPSNVTLTLFDERYSTVNATYQLKFEAKLKSSQIKKIKDKMSAVYMLQNYLDSK